MKLQDLAKVKAARVIGLDCSTKSLAFAVFDGGKPWWCGEITFEGSTPFERLLDAKRKVRNLVESGMLRGDYIAMEAAIYANNMQTAIKLAYVYGAVLGELMENNPVVVEKAPISWQTAIGNPNLTKQEKERIKNENPGKSDSWYKSRGREMRKHRTLDIARQHFNISSGSDNVGDAVGVALAVIRDDIR